MSQLSKTIVKPAQSPPAVGPYNHAVRVGDLLFCSGQIPVDPANPSAPSRKTFALKPARCCGMSRPFLTIKV
jgi:enamine deaminase RidA (YjgF/YER057c/UK114 family)